MSAVPKRPQMRISGFKKNYKFWSYLHASLNRENPNLDYFHFADAYQGTRRATNNHFKDLLKKLSSKQSNKLTKIAQDSMKLFDSREDNCNFGHAYQAYWERRNVDSLRQEMERENRKTVIKLNKLSNKRIRALAKDVSHPNEYEMDVDDQSENNLNTDDQSENKLNTDDQSEN
ncbi:hypothetical protein K501DRAFT_325182, partial [Backusella circina FSU 941]